VGKIHNTQLAHSTYNTTLNISSRLCEIFAALRETPCTPAALFFPFEFLLFTSPGNPLRREGEWDMVSGKWGKYTTGPKHLKYNTQHFFAPSRPLCCFA